MSIILAQVQGKGGRGDRQAHGRVGEWTRTQEASSLVGIERNPRKAL